MGKFVVKINHKFPTDINLIPLFIEKTFSKLCPVLLTPLPNPVIEF
jgi:hypothetical protein